ncbi:hypothetical protein AADZ90_001165 [Aestuariibius sp. 2305UL40-4]|uniref:hypothetical protein n=1 Tax=Aestuariibius violaceus TaxID=3234132 RepID=UPI00345E451B
MTGTDAAATQLHDTRITRRYFRKFEAITGHLARVAALMEAEGHLARQDVDVLARYLVGLTWTFRALRWKYMFAGRYAQAGQLDFDRSGSGFPIFSELLEMASDAAQANRHLAQGRSTEALKDEMLRVILGDLQIPTSLQYAMGQRLYYEEMATGELFWARNDPVALWQGNTGQRRRFLLHWAVYDSQVNLPTIYLMDVEDSGRTALPKDDRRWPAVQAHLIAQALAHLKLVTIARGFDRDFDDLHPKRLRRFHVGPMYSHAFTSQTGPLKEVMAAARAPEGEDWALVWTEENLVSERVEQEKAGWFGSVDREIFALDLFAQQGVVDLGATTLERSIILPQRVYQALAETRPPGFSSVRKFVVGAGGRVVSYR